MKKTIKIFVLEYQRYSGAWETSAVSPYSRLEDAVTKARQLSNIGMNYRVVRYSATRGRVAATVRS